jgi:hypothetical protein
MKNPMKTISFLILLTFASLIAYPQYEDPIYYSPPKRGQFSPQEYKLIPKNTKILKVYTGKPDTINFIDVTKLLIENNYEISRRDKEFLTIKTDFKQFQGTGNYYLNIRCSNDTIYVWGLFRVGLSVEMFGVKSEDSLLEIIKKGSADSIYGMAFYTLYHSAMIFGKVIF